MKKPRYAYLFGLGVWGLCLVSMVLYWWRAQNGGAFSSLYFSVLSQIWLAAALVVGVVVTFWASE